MALNFSSLLLNRDLNSTQIDEKLLTKIVSLSYLGDVRMDFKAESGDKINKIVQGNYS